MDALRRSSPVPSSPVTGPGSADPQQRAVRMTWSRRRRRRPRWVECGRRRWRRCPRPRPCRCAAARRRCRSGKARRSRGLRGCRRWATISCWSVSRLANTGEGYLNSAVGDGSDLAAQVGVARECQAAGRGARVGGRRPGDEAPDEGAEVGVGAGVPQPTRSRTSAVRSLLGKYSTAGGTAIPEVVLVDEGAVGQAATSLRRLVLVDAQVEVARDVQWRAATLAVGPGVPTLSPTSSRTVVALRVHR